MQPKKSFLEKLNERITKANSLLCVGLDPDMRQLPKPMRLADDPLFAFNKWLIELTASYACAFKVNSAFYEAEGASGWQTLQHTIAIVPPEIPVILDAKRGDVGPSSEAYARAAFDVLGADAVTVNPYLGGDALLPFISRPQHGVFVLCHTSNPGAETIQGMSCHGRALYERIAELALSWNTNGNVGLVVGATYPKALRRLRELAPQMVFLVPGLGAQGGDVQAAIDAGLNRNGRGMLLSVSRAIIYDARPDQAAARWRDAINAACAARQIRPSVPKLSSHDELILALHEAGCIQFGTFTLHSGEISPIYIDLRLLVSFPLLLQQVAYALTALLRNLDHDRIAAIPYAALPIGIAAAIELNRPLIYPRREAKTYGTRRSIEGQFTPGEQAVVLDDLITTGDSKLEAIAALQSAGLRVKDIVVLIDREQGGAEQLAQQGYRVHSVLKLSQVLQVLVAHGRISSEQYEQVYNWLDKSRGAKSSG
nr:orotidine-5'-phosphate decarboxylase [Chloroflexota bacterium]